MRGEVTPRLSASLARFNIIAYSSGFNLFPTSVYKHVLSVQLLTFLCTFCRFVWRIFDTFCHQVLFGDEDFGVDHLAVMFWRTVDDY